jgi:Holliday junction DNA helicase RuvA
VIAKIHGRLESIKSTSVTIDIGGICYEIMVPPVLFTVLEEYFDSGRAVSLHTLHYLEGGFRGTSQIPRLIGFLDETDKNFFELYTTVKGLGEKTAMKSLVKPVREIALAIERGDERSLAHLPGITARLAGKIIAELKGKVSSFAAESMKEAVPAAHAAPSFVEEALTVLTGQLGFRRQEAEERIRKVLQAEPSISSAEALIRSVFYPDSEGDEHKSVHLER